MQKRLSDFFNFEKYSNYYWIGLIVLLSLPAILALSVPGFYGASDDLHIAWLHQLDKVVREGQLPPRFVPDLSYGFGYPLFNFVFPLPFYIAEVFNLSGLTLVGSIKLLFALSIPLSGYFMYKLLKEYTGNLLALAGAVVYMYTPYRSTDIYIRGAIGEITAFIFLPLSIFAVVKLFSSEKRARWAGILGISLACLITSHNIMAFMFFPFLLVLPFFLAVTVDRSIRLTVFLKTFSGFVLGILISMFFWLPAVIESKLMKEDTVFNFVDHFPTVRQLITPYFGYGASVAGPYDGMSFFAGTVNLLLVGSAFLYILYLLRRLLLGRNKIDKKVTVDKSRLAFLVWGLLVFSVSMVMMNQRSTFLWENLPYLTYFQFPWRFLSMITLATPLFVIVFSKFKYANYLALTMILITIVINYNYFHPQDFLGRQDDYYLNRYIPEPLATKDYMETGEEYLRLPKITRERPSAKRERVTIVGGELRDVRFTSSLDAEFTVVGAEQSRVFYNKYLFPGWKAKVNEVDYDISSGYYGEIVMDVPPGTHYVQINFSETNTRMVLNLASLLTLVLAVIMIVRRTNHTHAKA